MLKKPAARTFLESALRRGAENNAYDVRSYQITAATKAANELLAGRNAVLTLPTGTGKTVVCGMTAALVMAEQPDARTLFTAPRRSLLSQLFNRSRWINPTVPSVALGSDPRETDQHVYAAVHYGRLIFGMPEFLGNRLLSDLLPNDLIAQLRFLIIDEFDHFLTLRYRARDVTASFHDALETLLTCLGPSCRLLLVSATTPELPAATKPAEVEAQVDATAQAAFRRFLDARLSPSYVSIPPRYYADFIPHARIIAVAVEDGHVQALDFAIDEEIGLMLNWISGTLGFPIDPVYVLPRLSQILSGHLSLAPGLPRSFLADVAGLLGRLQWLSHLSDFVYEDMARNTDWRFEDTFRYDRDLKRRLPAQVRRINDPPEEDGQKVMYPAFRGKADGLLQILARHRDEKGVIFFRNVRILELFASRLREEGRSIAIVHGAQPASDNDAALASFRARENLLLLITRDTGKRGLDLPEADFAVFYSPKSREDVTWQEVSRIRSTLRDRKNTYILFYAGTGEAAKMAMMIAALEKTTHSKEITITHLVACS